MQVFIITVKIENVKVFTRKLTKKVCYLWLSPSSHPFYKKKSFTSDIKESNISIRYINNILCGIQLYVNITFVPTLV